MDTISNTESTASRIKPLLVVPGILGDALQEALTLWGYEGIKRNDAKDVLVSLRTNGQHTVVLTSLFTKQEEDMARDLLVSVRLLRGDCARVPFVFLALDAHVPPIFLTVGCHLRVLPRDAASLEHIHALKGPSDKECEEFITAFGKPALWDRVLKQGRILFHNPAKRSLSIKSAKDMNELSDTVHRFCGDFMSSLDCMGRDARVIGLSLADVWPEIDHLKETVMRLKKFASPLMEMTFFEAKQSICSERESIIDICSVLEKRLQDFKNSRFW